MESDPDARFAHAIEHEEPAESSSGFAGRADLEEMLDLLRETA